MRQRVLPGERAAEPPRDEARPSLPLRAPAPPAAVLMLQAAGGNVATTRAVRAMLQREPVDIEGETVEIPAGAAGEAERAEATAIIQELKALEAEGIHLLSTTAADALRAKYLTKGGTSQREAKWIRKQYWKVEQLRGLKEAIAIVRPLLGVRWQAQGPDPEAEGEPLVPVRRAGHTWTFGRVADLPDVTAAGETVYSNKDPEDVDSWKAGYEENFTKLRGYADKGVTDEALLRIMGKQVSDMRRFNDNFYVGLRSDCTHKDQVWRADAQTTARGTIMHEIGHAVWKNQSVQWARFLRELKQDPSPEPPPTTYGKDDDQEDFAEAFMLFNLAPSTLAGKAPKRYAYFQGRQQEYNAGVAESEERKWHPATRYQGELDPAWAGAPAPA